MTVRLAVAGAFHTHFMQPAEQRLRLATYILLAALVCSLQPAVCLHKEAHAAGSMQALRHAAWLQGSAGEHPVANAAHPCHLKRGRSAALRP